jgi:hypothetical protein
MLVDEPTRDPKAFDYILCVLRDPASLDSCVSRFVDDVEYFGVDWMLQQAPRHTYNHLLRATAYSLFGATLRDTVNEWNLRVVKCMCRNCSNLDDPNYNKSYYRSDPDDGILCLRYHNLCKICCAPKSLRAIRLQ